MTVDVLVNNSLLDSAGGEELIMVWLRVRVSESIT